MKKKIIHISVVVIIVLVIIGIFSLIMSNIFKQFDDVPIGNITSNITINNDGTIDVIDNILVNITGLRE